MHRTTHKAVGNSDKWTISSKKARHRIGTALCEALEERRLLTVTYYVSNTSDSGGNGSLRLAINNANSYASQFGGTVDISFDIPTSDPNYKNSVFTITPSTQLPTITGSNIVIDGNTQKSFNSVSNGTRPVIYIDGAGKLSTGLSDTGTSDQILNLGVNDFSSSTTAPAGGMLIQGTSDVIEGCWVGISPSGTAAAGNNVGICTYLSNKAYISDGGSGETNVIGDNSVGIQMIASNNALVYNTDVGVTPTNAAATNSIGIELLSTFYGTFYGNSSNNYITTTQVDNSTLQGILLTGTGVTNNVLDSDQIGVVYLSGSGYYAAPNGSDGILMSNNAQYNSVVNYQGTPAASPTLIAGNSGNGIEIDNSSYNLIEGAIIGEATHRVASGAGYILVNAPNTQNGIYIHDGATNNSIGASAILSAPTSVANVISGNGAAGISMADTSSLNNLISGNYIGTDSLSSTGIGNAHEGILLFAPSTTVSGCVISGNGYSGVSIPGYYEIVENCKIGTNVAGSAALGNAHEGVYVNGTANTLQYNTISGNAYTGVTTTGGHNITLLSNNIGTDSTGTAAIPNQLQGVNSGAANDSLSYNIISGNTLNGVTVSGSGTSLYQNQIGCNANGSTSITNGQGGVYLIGNTDYINDNTISGNSAGAGYGIELDTSSSYQNTIIANFIGTDSVGQSTGNVNGVVVQNGALNNSIGTLADGNTISGNSHDGIFITNNSNGTMIAANFIGTDVTGLNAVPNGFDGIELNSSNTTIGGNGPGYRNTISGNMYRDGIVVEGSGVTNDLIQGNYVGTDTTGTVALPNSSGIEIISGSSQDTIVGNVISGNSNRGVAVFGSGSTGSTVQGNLIGTDHTGTAPIGNGGIGLYISSDKTTIGGATPGQGNTIDFNAGGGIDIVSSSSTSINATTVYNNSNGGIINAGTLSIVNSTIAGNTSTSGAGIYNAGTLTLNDSTIAFNSASSTGGGIDAAGGTTLMENDLVAQNTGGDVTGTVSSSSSYNLIGNGSGLNGISNGANHNQIGTPASPINPLLGPLANNGGTTETIAIPSTSPAANAGVGISNISTDQRGSSRPTAGVVDLGAVQRAGYDVDISDATAIYLRDSSDGRTLDVYLNNTGAGSPDYTYLLTDLAEISIEGTNLDDQITLDYTNGPPLAFQTGLAYDGIQGSNTLKVIGTTGNDTIGVNASNITVGNTVASYANVQSRIIDPLSGSDSVTVAAGLTASFSSAASGGGALARYLSTANIGANARLTVPTALNHSDRTLLIIQNPLLAAGATLDLGGNDADLQASSLSTVNGWVAMGFYSSSASWTGIGIDSSAAAATRTHLTALGVIQNNQGGIPIFSTTHLFDGTAPAPTDVLVKYTYYGDANLDGKVDASDYSRIDNAYVVNKISPATYTGWFNGDFNYDGVINGSDYTLIDNAFNMQGASLASNIAEQSNGRSSPRQPVTWIPSIYTQTRFSNTLLTPATTTDAIEVSTPASHDILDYKKHPQTRWIMS